MKLLDHKQMNWEDTFGTDDPREAAELLIANCSQWAADTFVQSEWSHNTSNRATYTAPIGAGLETGLYSELVLAVQSADAIGTVLARAVWSATVTRETFQAVPINWLPIEDEDEPLQALVWK